MYTKRNTRKQTLNVLLCGPNGTGKSSFINTLVGRRVIYENEHTTAPEYANTLVFQPTTVEMDEPLSDGSKLVLTLVETEGFGNDLRHEIDVEQVATYIENKFDEVLAEESRIRRNPRFKDDRIDVCLYFIQTTGHGLRELDFLTLKRLSNIVNVIPVLSRADQLTPSERVLNKRLVNEDLRFADIGVFDFQFSDADLANEVAAFSNANRHGVDGYLDGETPGSFPDGDIETAALLQETSPFALTSSNQFDEHDECLFLRKFPYGIVEVLNPKHSDVELLRNAMFGSFFAELKDRTHDVLYETYRTHRLDPQQKHRASLLLPQQLADHAARLKQAQIEREQKLLRDRELRVISEIEAKRAILLKREQELRELEQKMAEQQLQQQQQQQQQLQNQFQERDEQHLQQQYGQHSDQQAAVDQQAALTNAPAPQTANPTVSYGVSRAAAAQAEEKRVRQTQSKKELRQHTKQLHAELGDLEQQKQDIQNRRMSVHGNTSPLNIQKAFE